MKPVDKIKALFKRKPKVVEEERKKERKGAKNVKDLKKRGLKRVPALKKNNVDCQYVHPDW